MNGPSYFITGTDTEVGKTLIAGALILRLKQLGHSVAPFKPVVAGTYLDARGHERNEDLETLKLASGLDLDDQDICPYRLTQAAAPHLVAPTQHLVLECDRMIQGFEALQARHSAVVVEGAGGFMVPINDQEGLDHFATRLGLPVILVVGLRLGCINHALLSAEALAHRHLHLAGWVGNAIDPHMQHADGNMKTLRDRLQAPCLGWVSHHRGTDLKPTMGAYPLASLQWAASQLRLPEEL